jgi:hypothetical protein
VLAALRERAASEPGEPAPPPFAVAWRREAPGALALEVDAGDLPAVVAIAEGYHPWWRATVDGRPTPVLRQSLALLAVPVGPGAHAVTLRFLPPLGVRASEWLSAAGWLGVVVFAAGGLRARLTRPRYSR